MTKIVETETFSVNGDSSLHVLRTIDFLEGEGDILLNTKTNTVADKFVNKESYRAEKENLVREGKMEMGFAANKIAEAEKILRELDQLDKQP